MKSMDFCVSDTGDQASPGTAGVTDDAIPALPEPPKRRGRPKGLGKVPGSGRKAGQKNWSTPEIRDALLSKSNAIDVLADIAAGKPLLVGTERTSSETGAGTPVWRYPTINQRLKALEMVLGKVLPDLKSTEVTASVEHREAQEPRPPREVARALLSAVAKLSLETGVNFRLEEAGGPIDADGNVTKPPPILPGKISESD